MHATPKYHNAAFKVVALLALLCYKHITSYNYRDHFIVVEKLFPMHKDAMVSQFALNGPLIYNT